MSKLMRLLIATSVVAIAGTAIVAKAAIDPAKVNRQVDEQVKDNVPTKTVETQNFKEEFNADNSLNLKGLKEANTATVLPDGTILLERK